MKPRSNDEQHSASTQYPITIHSSESFGRASETTSHPQAAFAKKPSPKAVFLLTSYNPLHMSDSTIIKVDSAHSPKGADGEKYLASGKQVSMRLWENEQPNEAKEPTSRPYETVGYVLQGRAELHLEGQMVLLEPGHSWVVPKGASHTYKILEDF